ncbi:MAG: type II secretion system protein GspK [Planctomycetes bacterium]|nr:type II secretion system protein GspK [Planctomycetota bacterium]
MRIEVLQKNGTRNRRQSRLPQPSIHRRRASILILTLVVVALLTLGTMAFFERMFAEHRASRAHGRQLQARHMAESGVEYLKAVLAQDPLVIRDSGGLYVNPSMFQGVTLVNDPLGALRGQFTVIAPDITTDGLYGGIRYGLENESSRLNLNTVLLADSSSDDAARKLLMTLPGMTETVADSILDWIDSDDEPRMLGAERNYYSTLSPPYAPRNGPLGSIEELLLVRDVTPALLFGADLNRNSGVDVIEEPLTVIDNADNSLGLLNRGWAAYITLDSAETNLRPDGTRKIDVNKEDLKKLHQELTEALGAEMANFIVAYRQGGKYDGDEPGKAASAINLDLTQPGRERITTILDLIGVRTRIATQTQPGQNGQGQGDAGGQPSQGGAPTPSEGGGQGSQGQEKNNSRIVVNEAFAKDPASMKSYLAKLMDNIAVNADRSIPGRLNINQAPRQLLIGIPNLSPNAVDQIISQRDVTLGQQQPDQIHETWILTEGIVDLAQMKKLISLVTTGGSVYRAQVVGGYFTEGPTERLEVVIDATKMPPVVRRRMELRDLGQGYASETLGATLDDLP